VLRQLRNINAIKKTYSRHFVMSPAAGCRPLHGADGRAQWRRLMDSGLCDNNDDVVCHVYMVSYYTTHDY